MKEALEISIIIDKRNICMQESIMYDIINLIENKYNSDCTCYSRITNVATERENETSGN